MKLIVGLGNPGTQYASTRHNIGWIMLDAVMQSLGADSMTTAPKLHGSISKIHHTGVDICFFKPQTFMNCSGGPVRDIMQLYQIEKSDILILHDDIDLPIGTIQHKAGGGHAGHNGIRDIISQTGGSDFARVRIGVGRPVATSVVDRVLGTLPSADLQEILSHRDEVLSIITTFSAS